MAARVVWLVANGYAAPRRGARADVHPQGRGAAAAPGPHPAGAAGRRRPGSRRLGQRGHGRRPGHRQHLPRVRRARCCASTACCCRSSPTPGCSARPSCGSWRFAWCASIPEQLDTDKTPAAVTAMVLRLVGPAGRTPRGHRPTARHPRRAGTAGAHAAGRSVSARPRAQPVAAAHAGHPDRAHRAGAADRRAARADARREGHGLRHADGLGRPAGVDVPAGRRAAAAAVPGGAARRVPGHRARAARRAVVTVRRRRRRRPGADGRRRPDPVDLRLAGRVGDQPAAVHHRLPARGRHARRPRWSCAPAGAIRRGRCIWRTRCPPRRGAVRSRCGRCGRGPTPSRAPSDARC